MLDITVASHSGRRKWHSLRIVHSVGLVSGFAKHLYERLPDVQAFSALTDRWVAALYPAFDAASLATAGPYEIRGLTPHS